MRNLISLIAWHDSGWNGRVCRNPKENKYCESFGYVIRKRKYEFCVNNPDANLGNSRERACSEAIVFCKGKVQEHNIRFPAIFYVDRKNRNEHEIKMIKKEIEEQLRMINGKYAILYVRENPLSENRVIVGCVKIKEIIDGSKDYIRKNRVLIE